MNYFQPHIIRVASHFYKKIQEQFQNISSTLTCFSRTKKKGNFERQNLTGYQQGGRSNIFWWERPNRNTPSLLPFPSSPYQVSAPWLRLPEKILKLKFPHGRKTHFQDLKIFDILWIF